MFVSQFWWTLAQTQLKINTEYPKKLLIFLFLPPGLTQRSAEGCEEEYITHIFPIQLKHNLSAINEIKKGQIEFNHGKQE